ncbi:MAG TPA: PepSY domain-containing protein [Bacilli bacterium]|nr:PepSY domain-containing protein [Bacilli bacterium]
MTSLKVSFDQALSIVSDAYPGLTLLSLALDDENGIHAYQAELLNPVDNSIIEFTINGESGEIFTQAAEENNQNEQDENGGADVQFSDNTQDETYDDDENGSETNRGESKGDEFFTLNLSAVTITFDQALSTAKEAYPGHTLLTLGLENENGVLMYQAALLNPADDSVVGIAIDCISGQILPQTAENDQNEIGEQGGENIQYEDKSDDNGNDAQRDAFDMSAVKVSFNQALSIANTAYPDYTLFALQLDSENGNLLYQVELFNTSNNTILEVKIDCISGQVLSQSPGLDEQNDNVDENGNGTDDGTGNDN